MHIKSMTGYGSAKGSSAGFEYTIELKSVNNRHLDVSVRMPRVFMFAEEAIKASVKRYITRGKVDVFINIDSSGTEDVQIKVNENLAEAYIQAVRNTAEKYKLDMKLSALDVVRFQDVMTVEKKEADHDEIISAMCSVLEEALSDFDAMRMREGDGLAVDIRGKLDNIERMTAFVEERSPKTVTEYREKLNARMQEVLDGAGIEESRILAEAAIYADKVSVDEETVRLRSHIEQFRSLLNDGSPLGKKPDYLVQEMNRETNTIGSKCGDIEISRRVIDMKAELEKIREQIQNIE